MNGRSITTLTRKNKALTSDTLSPSSRAAALHNYTSGRVIALRVRKWPALLARLINLGVNCLHIRAAKLTYYLDQKTSVESFAVEFL